MIYIYILKLKSNKYYIGKTSNPKFRLDSHFNYNGSSWTKKYKPINIHQLIPDCDIFDEDKYTLKYIKKYGINNVRGGSFCQMKLTNENKKTIEKMIMSATDKCYKCGQKGHFASKCDHESEENCDICVEDLEMLFNEGDKNEGMYELDGKKYLWYNDELYEESNNKTPKSLLKSFRLNDRFDYEHYNWKSIHSKTNNKSSVKKNKAYGCQYCDKEFTSQRGATFHENIHCKKKKWNFSNKRRSYKKKSNYFSNKRRSFK